MDYTIHWLPIIAVIIVNLILGMVWYSPKNALGRYWIKHCKVDMDAGASEGQEKEMRKMVMKSVGIQIIVTGVEAWLFGVLMHAAFAITLGPAIHLALLAWVAFVIPSYIGAVLWEGKPWGLFLLYTSNQLLNLLVMAVVFAYWG
jgi:hypothetical protein